MPSYCYECPKGHDYEEVLSVSDYQKPTNCPKCGKVGKKVIKLKSTEPSFSDKIFPYYDPNLGKEVSSRSQRDKIMAQMGFVSKEGHRRTTAKQERYLYQQRLHMRPPR